MKIYRVAYGSSSDPAESTGFTFHTSKRKARQALKSGTPHDVAGIDPISVRNVRLTKTDLLTTLAYWASHPDNG